MLPHGYLKFLLIPFIISALFTPLVRILALKYGLVAFPRADRWHKQPTALLGGISIYLAAISCAIPLYHADKTVLMLLAGGTFLFIAGLLDDKVHLAPYTKLFLQIIAGSFAIFAGVRINLPLGLYLSIPVTLLWIVGVTNAFNLLDNIDGLASGISAICAFMLFFTSLIFSNNQLGFYALIIAGASLGFLPYNFSKAKIFMGDSGSMFLGYSIAIISATGTSRHVSNVAITLLIPVLILGVPIFDTIFVMISRMVKGKKMFEGGKDHTSHRLVTLGLSQKKAVLLLYSISIAFGLIGLSYFKLSMFVVSVIAFLAFVILLYFGLYIYDRDPLSVAAKLKDRNGLANGDTIVLNKFLMHKRRIVEVFLDFMFICVAYWSAYLLRFEEHRFETNIIVMKDSLMWIILIKMSVFFIFGLYRGVWKYISIADFFTIFKTVTLGSICSILFLTFMFRFQDFSRAVFFIDWLILLLFTLGSRFLFRMLGEFFSRLRSFGKKVLIYGAGDTGEMVLREMRRNKEFAYTPVGFIDDDPRKVGSKIHGVPVLASGTHLRTLIKDNNAEEIFIAITRIDDSKLESIIEVCKEYGVAFRKIKGILD